MWPFLRHLRIPCEHTAVAIYAEIAVGRGTIAVILAREHDFGWRFLHRDAFVSPRSSIGVCELQRMVEENQLKINSGKYGK